jgi:two-component system phosphate regulon sensor histidine kinase PhoR
MHSFLKKANKNAARLGQIVKDLDSITKFESGVLNIQKNPFDLGQLINEVIEELEIQASNKEISLFFQGKTSGIMVIGDRDRITQVLINLGFNSIRYGKQGGTTNYKLSDTGEKIIVEVIDNGIGIPLQHQNRIFERFYRVDAHRNRETGGSGLGLSICKHIIDAHGEKIQVISTEGAGSVFSFALPKAK